VHVAVSISDYLWQSLEFSWHLLGKRFSQQRRLTFQVLLSRKSKSPPRKRHFTTLCHLGQDIVSIHKHLRKQAPYPRTRLWARR
jgi:hypothetical protein